MLGECGILRYNRCMKRSAILEMPAIPRPARITAVIALILSGIFSLFGALIAGLMSVTLLPACINGLTTVPVRSILVMICYPLSSLAYLVIGGGLIRIGYLLARQKTVRKRLLVVVLGAALIFIICYTILKIILD